MMNFKQKAIWCFEENLIKKDALKLIDKETAETLLILTNHYKELGDLDKAMNFASWLLDFTGIEKQEAQNIIYEMNIQR